MTKKSGNWAIKQKVMSFGSGSEHLSCEEYPDLQYFALAHAVTQSRPILWTSSPPGSSVHETVRQESRGEMPFPPPGVLPIKAISPASPALQAYSLLLSHCESPSSISLLLNFWSNQRDRPDSAFLKRIAPN